MKSKSKASVLAFTMIVLGIVLVTALSLSFAAIQERKGSIGAGKTNVAYQFADSGLEKVLQLIQSSTDPNTDLISTTVDKDDGICDGVYNNSADGYKVELMDNNGDLIDICTGRTVSEIRSIKSIGTTLDGRAQRAVAVAAGTGSGITGGCQFGVAGSEWGSGCDGTALPAASCSAAADTSYECGETATGFCICVNP